MIDEPRETYENRWREAQTTLTIQKQYFDDIVKMMDKGKGNIQANATSMKLV